LNFTQPDGPVYIYLKDTGDYTTRWIESGLMVDLAREHNGSLFTFDYRYFAGNQPTPTASFEDLQFLTPEQILADLAQFITAIQLLHDVYGSNVIVYGSGYGGTLATWARKKFPHLIHGAWSSSGIFELVVASISVYDSLSYSIYRTSGSECRDFIAEAFEAAEQLVINDEGEELQELFNLCSPVDTDSQNDVSLFFQSFYDMLIDYVQQQHGRGIQTMCEDLQGVPLEPLESFARWVNYVFMGPECFDASYASRIGQLTNTSWNQPGTLSGRRQWAYIQCTQSGLFQVTDNFTWLPNYVEILHHIQICMDVLGEDYVFDNIRGALAFLSNQYGSLYLRSSRTIFTNGDIDPKMYNGIIYTNDPESVAFNIQAHGRASDMPSIQQYDSAHLFEVKENIIELVGNWSTHIWT